MWYMKILYLGLIPDWLLRWVLSRITGRKIRQLTRLSEEARHARRQVLIEKLDGSPIAIVPHLPNVQHYEVPPAFFQLVLGKRLKYSCCLWQEPSTSLDEAEEKMLDLTCQRAELEDGMRVLDLGCGWGSLSLWIAEEYPRCQITAVSNSRDQVAFINKQAADRGYENLTAQRVDVNQLADTHLGKFDRVLSIEMFEHMKNYRRLLEVISDKLETGGKLFVHHFSHRKFAYEYEEADAGNWMAQTLFTGGTMPSDDLLLHFLGDFRVDGHWQMGGEHYRRTLRAWLDKMDNQEEAVKAVLADTYGEEHVRQWWVNWRLFFMACEMTWGYKRGREYIVSHYLFQKP
jgi:cyclopropane-fatty-acyl-phospholipid synthase